MRSITETVYPLAPTPAPMSNIGSHFGPPVERLVAPRSRDCFAVSQREEAQEENANTHRYSLLRCLVPLSHSVSQTAHDSSGGHGMSDVLKSNKCGGTHGAVCRLQRHSVQQVRGPCAFTSHPAPCEAPWAPLHPQAPPNSSTYHHNIQRKVRKTVGGFFALCCYPPHVSIYTHIDHEPR